MVGDDGARLHFFLSYVARERGERVERRKGREEISRPPFLLSLFPPSLAPHAVHSDFVEFLGYINMLPGFFSFSPFTFLLVLPLRFSSNLVFLQKIKTEGKKISFILRRSRGGYSSQYV
jgi:hypothetical protein